MAPPSAGTELGGCRSTLSHPCDSPNCSVSWLAGILAQLQPIIIRAIKAAVKCKQKLVAFTPGGKTLQPVLDAALDLLAWDMYVGSEVRKPQEGSHSSPRRPAGPFPGRKSCSKAEQKATLASLNLRDNAVPLKGLIPKGQDALFNSSYILSVLILVPKSYPKPLEVPTAPTGPFQHPKCLLIPAIATRLCHLQTLHVEMREMGNSRLALPGT